MFSAEEYPIGSDRWHVVISGISGQWLVLVENETVARAIAKGLQDQYNRDEALFIAWVECQPKSPRAAQARAEKQVADTWRKIQAAAALAKREKRAVIKAARRKRRSAAAAARRKRRANPQASPPPGL